MGLIASAVDAGKQILTIKAVYDSKKLTQQEKDNLYSHTIYELSKDGLSIVEEIFKKYKTK